ncbi:MAG: hemerythrin [bacterium]|nr:hemerythrin [bacterium]
MTQAEGSQAQIAPTAELKNEHKVILRVLAVLEALVRRARAGEGFEADSFASAVEFFRLFADACHHAKEEDLLFPVLEVRGIPRDGGPIGVMLEEHRLARGYTREMGQALEARSANAGAGADEAEDRFLAAADNYLLLLTNHIFKEDNVLFQMGDRVLSEADQESLRLKFCDVGCRAFDGKTREQLEEIAVRLETRWNLA